MSPLEEAEALVASIGEMYARCRVRSEQIALSTAYWRAVRVRDALRVAVAA